MKNVKNETDYMKYLLGYERGIIISEQKNTYVEDDNEYDTTTEQTTDPDTKTVTKSGKMKTGLGFLTPGNIEWTPGTLSANFKYTKELDKELNTVGDVLEKLNSEVGNIVYKSAPQETKEKIAQGFFDALNLFADRAARRELKNKKGELGLTNKLIRKLKKFFKKSQRWEFIVSEDLFKNKKNQKLYYDVEETGGTLTLEQIKQQTEDLLTQIVDANTSSEAVISTIGQIMADGNQIEIQKPVLSTTIPVLTQNLKISTKEEASSSTQKVELPPVNVSQMELAGYRAGESNPKAVISTVMSEVMKAIYATSVTYDFYNNETGKYEKRTKTIKEMVDCGEYNCPERFTIEIEGFTCTTSASNTWTGTDILDFTHSNDGTKVKEFSQISTKGNNGLNRNLAIKRGNLLAQTVVTEITKTSGFALSPIFDWENPEQVIMDYRVTDTGGKVDESRVRSTHPQPGQTASFTFNLGVVVRQSIDKPSVNQMDGLIQQIGIQLRYKGKIGGGFSLALNFEPGDLRVSRYTNAKHGWLSEAKYKRRRWLTDWIKMKKGTISKYSQKQANRMARR